MKHICIKTNCKAPYEDNDLDDYYCPPCLEQKKILCAELDLKMSNRPQERGMTGIEMYDTAPKIRGFARWQE